jgi:phosphoribosylglycinamide formyltransferase-1
VTLKLGWFTAGRGQGSRAMFEHTLAAIDAQQLDAKIEFVFMHRERGEGDGSDAFMDRASSLGIPLLNHSSKRFREEHAGDFAGHRGEYDAQIAVLVSPYATDVDVLAGYLLILSPELVNERRFVNLHPALPDGPVGLWQHVIWELISSRAASSGSVVFEVTPELDRGPQISYASFPLRSGALAPMWNALGDGPIDGLREQFGEKHPLFRAIREEGVRREPLFLTETLKEMAERAGQCPESPIDLTARVDAALAAASSLSA